MAAVRVTADRLDGGAIEQPHILFLVHGSGQRSMVHSNDADLKHIQNQVREACSRAEEPHTRPEGQGDALGEQHRPALSDSLSCLLGCVKTCFVDSSDPALGCAGCPSRAMLEQSPFPRKSQARHISKLYY